MRSLLAAVQFLTRIPVPGLNPSPREIGRSAFWFPVVGLAVGGITLGAYLLSLRFFPAPIARLLPLLVQVLVSGAFHLDGLADTVDALYGGKDREGVLRIMKDPHLGAMGAITIALTLLLKAAVLLTLPEGAYRGALLTAPVLGHAAMVGALALPYARAEGLGKAFSEHRSALDLPLAVLLSVLLSFGALEIPGLQSLAAAAVAGSVPILMARRRIGGVTGDVCGAANEMAELGYLLALTGFVR